MIFRRKFLYPKFAVLARSKQLVLMPVTVKFRLDFFVCGFPCNNSHEAMKNCRDCAFSLRGLEVLLPAFQLPMFEKCEALPKGDLFDMLVKGNPCLS